MVAHIKSYIGMLSETNQDCLEEQGGTCIMYTHFGHGFVEDQRLNSRFADLMTRLSKRNGWFVPVSTSARLRSSATRTVQTRNRERNRRQNRWLWQKIFRGTS